MLKVHTYIICKHTHTYTHSETRKKKIKKNEKKNQIISMTL